MRNAARLRLWSNLLREIAKDAASLLLNRYIFRQMQEVVRRNRNLDLQHNFDELGLDGLIAIGGEDTLSVAYAAFAKFHLPIVGVPKTIDNDLCGTDTTIGSTTAYTVVTEVVDRLHSTAESHDMIHIIEVMGRNTGWIERLAVFNFT